jgi:hypothetical protein
VLSDIRNVRIVEWLMFRCHCSSRVEFRERRYMISDTSGYSKCTSEWLKTDKPRTMVDCCVALACPFGCFSATDQVMKADTSDCRQFWQSTTFVYYKIVSPFRSIFKHRLVFGRSEWLVCVFNFDCFGRYLEALLHDSCKVGLCVKVAATGSCGVSWRHIWPIK